MEFEKTEFNLNVSKNKKVISDFEKSLQDLSIDLLIGGHSHAKKQFELFVDSHGWARRVKFGCGKRQIFAQKDTVSLFFNSGPASLSAMQLIKLKIAHDRNIVNCSLFVFLSQDLSRVIQPKGGMEHYENFLKEYEQLYFSSFGFPVIVYGLW